MSDMKITGPRMLATVLFEIADGVGAYRANDYSEPISTLRNLGLIDWGSSSSYAILTETGEIFVAQLRKLARKKEATHDQ